MFAALLSTSARADTIVPPAVLHAPDPAYPDDAFREGVAGDVVMDVEVAADGGVARVVVSTAPDARLAWAALGALSNFRFEPARRRFDDGHEHAIAVRLTYALTFAIDDNARQALLHDDGAIDDVSSADSVVHDDRAIRDDDLPPLPAVGAGEAVVRARRRREDVTKTLTQSTAVLDEAALARVRGRTLAGTLVEVPGVTMVQSGPAVAKPVVRGLFGRRLVMLTDGVRHEGQDWGIDHAPEIDPQAAGTITVVKGAAGVRFGPDAIGGVVLLEPRRLRLDPGIDGEVNVVGVDNGLIGTAGGRVDWVPAAVPSLSLRFEANASKGAAVSTPTYVLGNTATETFNVGAAAEWRGSLFDRALTAKLSYHRYQATLGICYCLEVNTPAALQASALADRPIGADQWTTSYDVDRPRQQISHDTAIARVTADLGDVGTLTTTYAFQLDRRDEFDQARRAVTGPQFSFNLVTHAVDVAFQHAMWRSGDLTLSGQVGVHLDLQQHAYSGLQLIPNYRRATGGVFVLERLVIDDAMSLGDLEFIVGGRVDGLTQTSFLTEAAYATQVRRGRIDDDDCALAGDVARCDKALPAASVTAGTRLHLDVVGVRDAVVFAVDVSSAARFPDVDELYLGGRSPSLPVFGLGDAGLGTERTLQLSVGAELKLPFVVAEAGVFASRINDYIAFGPELDARGQPIVDVLITGAYPRFSSQAVEAMMSGVDGGLVVFPGALLSGSAQIAVVRGLDLTHGGYLPFIPPTQARLGLQSNLPTFATAAGPVSSSSISTGVVFMARQERSDARSDFVAPAAAYAVWNADASGAIDVGGVPVRLGLEVRNILDQRYREQMSLLRFFAEQPGREVWLRLSIAFDAS